MHIVCPYCTTSYAIKLATLGANGRTVRCSRCKETWVARPEDAIEEEAPAVAMAAASRADAMGALVVALIVWRADMVRLLPQTAAFYKMAGFEVNLRGLAFKDVKVTSETVDGKQVLVIEGVIVGETKKAVDIPRLRFSVRDAQGAEIYAWNAVLE
jgi:predicted Zn finger-like uncharacterized protein